MNVTSRPVLLMLLCSLTALGVAEAPSVSVAASAPATNHHWGARTPVLLPGGGPNDVSCATPTMCVAVDDSGDALTYDGSAWSAPVHLTDSLDEVSCPTRSFCLATDSGGDAFRYDGSTWAASAPVGIVVPHYLYALSCSSPAFCAAVTAGGFAFVFNGTSWTGPTRIDGKRDLYSVSCSSPTFCAAADPRGYVTLFNGSTWGAPTLANVPVQYGQHVSCVSASWCVDTAGDSWVTWDGSAWSSPQLVDPLHHTTSGFGSLSCSSTTFCALVDASGPYTFDGTTWVATPHQDPRRYPDAFSCPTSTFCLGILIVWGTAFTYDGSGWSNPVLFDPFHGGQINLACPSASFCMATDANGEFATWDGSRWSAPSYLPTSAKDYGYSVSCVSSSFCMATYQSSVYVYDGLGWHRDSVERGGFLMAVSCASTHFCVAVDQSRQAIFYDGTSWGSPQSIDVNARLVSCASPTFCVAADGYQTVDVYNGATWTAMSVGTTGEVDGLSCASATSCVAADLSDVYAYDGTKWTKTTVDTSPLSSVSCPTTAFCLASDASGGVLVERAGTWQAPVVVDPAQAGVVACASAHFCAYVDGAGYALTSGHP